MTRTLQHSMPIGIRPVAPAELESLAPALTDLLRDSVNRGASLGFMPPLAHDEGRAYWLSLRSELQAGSRLLLGAYLDSQLIGSGQLALASWPNAQHRAEIQKLFVASAARGLGIGRSLMVALHDAARLHGRSLLVLGTRHGEAPEKFYKRFGYREAGVIPGYTVGPAGERFDNLTLYRELAA